ncbi:TadG family pilus assembly protein [Pseudomonas chlororaphis]|uniref:TadG family pilus assembly protein n=1 Tax=Pseudomonas chlororaphis TaxID=587753 RepID=UPI0007B37AC1|nr:TadG family pilus assembly protein [Pseudomonas chlororaphis]AZC48310.1 putative transmembrane protein [Pseudomonas chlororaphis subsp. piscium]AZC54887.1 putative transmembrane protein [Pseudomonas chlororaphis subsp. piscium]AZC61209.1 putative transmembrane protein [Pseudomonas chlororaphis subsp. piscium]AZC67432.1 putative transmembrane protein [Pseudomonas chlororaphis subsp. piscium]AZC79846.1 putative transmembrane protein [Pseudomonas chlororaphis subsp. piscium]
MFPRMQFSGPARQRGAIGLIGALALGTAVLCTLVVVDSGRLYLDQRELQRVADNAALEAVARGGNCQAGLSAAAFARESAARNGFAVGDDRPLTATCGSLRTGADNLRTFSPNASQASAIRVVVSERVPTSIALGVTNLFSDNPVSATTSLSASAVAAQPKPPLAQLTIRSTLADLNLLNGALSGLAGSAINVSLLGWQGLVDTDISLLSYLNQLAIDLNVSAGSYSELLDVDTDVTQLIQTSIAVAQKNGATAEVLTALGSIKAAAINTVPVKLGELLKLQTGTADSGLDANVQLLSLVEAFLQLASSQSAAAVTLPVSVLGLAGVTTRVKIVSPPEFAVGNPELAAADPLGPNRIYVRTAQVRALLTVDLSLINSVLQAVNTLLSPVVVTLNTVLSANLSCVLGGPCVKTDLMILPNGANLDVSLEVAAGDSHVTGYTCVSDSDNSLSVDTTTSAVKLKVGRVDASNWASSTAQVSVSPLPLVDIGARTCQGLFGPCGARVSFAGGGSEVMINTSIAGTHEPNFTFVNPPKMKQELADDDWHSVIASNVVSSLRASLTGISLIQHPPTIGSLLGVVLNTLLSTLNSVVSLLATAIGTLLGPLLDPLLNNVLAVLGIDLGKVEVGANLTCGQTGRAYLVL